MQNKGNYQKQPNTGALFGEMTVAKASGLSFSVVAILPTVLFIIVGIILSCFGLTGEGYEKTQWYLYLQYVLSQISFGLIALFWLYSTKKPLKRAVKAQKCAPKYYVIALLLQVGLLFLSQLNGWFVAFLEKLGYPQTPPSIPNLQGWGFFFATVAIALLPALFEEIFFRGVLLKGLRGFSKAGVILLCGGLFALYHQNPAQTLYQFCCGVAFALVAVKAGSIFPTVLSHFLNNFFILLLEKQGVSSFSPTVTAWIFALSFVCLVGTFVYLLAFDKNDKKPNGQVLSEKEKKNERKNFLVYSAFGVIVCALVWVVALFGVGK